MLMEKLSIITISFSMVLTQLIFAIGFAAASLNDKHRYMRILTLGLLINGIGFVLSGLWQISIFLGVFLGNILLVVGNIVFLIGVFKLIDRVINKKLIITVFISLLVGYLYFIYVDFNFLIRIIIFSVGIFILLVYFGLTMWRYFLEKRYWIALLLSISCFVYGLLHIFRSILMIRSKSENLMTNVDLLIYMYLLTIAFNIILGLSVVFLSTKLYSIELIESNTALEKLSTIDYLTKVHNLRSLIKNFEIEKARTFNSNKPMVIVLLDLDFFKKINDIYGHLIGDEVLIKISEIFKKNLRRIDIFGRYGGEEFLIILPETTLQKTKYRITKIQEIIREYNWEYEGLKVTFSAGIIEINEKNNFKEINHLINEADQLLYRAKTNGRDRIEI